jgi:hypothetical protein
MGGLAFCRAQGVCAPGSIGIDGWGGMTAATAQPRRNHDMIRPPSAFTV